jgi:hypothetical protein
MKISKPTRPTPTANRSTVRSSNTPAGGIGSRNVKPGGVRNGQMPFGVSPRAVSQIGSSLGNHVTDGSSKLPYRGERWLDKTPIGVPLGNELAAKVKPGPGGSREVFKSGSQQGMPTTPQPVKSSGGDILREFGPDSKR